MYPEKDEPPIMLILSLVALIILLVASSMDDSEPTTYRHAVVDGVAMNYRYDCDFDVLYNLEGQVMEDIDGNNIPCTEILTTDHIWKNTPLSEIQELLVEKDK